MDHYCPFTPPPIKNLKIEKNCWTYHNFTHVYQKPELYEVQFLRYGGTYNFLPFWVIFLPFYSPNNPQNKNFEKMKKASGNVIIYTCVPKSQSYDVCFMQYRVLQTYFSSFWAIFCHFTSLTTWKLKFGKNTTNTWRYPLYMYTINKDHMIYGSWNIKCNLKTDSFLSFWANFCPLTLLTTQKIKILKKWKNHLEIISFYNLSFYLCSPLL